MSKEIKYTNKVQTNLSNIELLAWKQMLLVKNKNQNTLLREIISEYMDRESVNFVQDTNSYNRDK